MGPGPGPSAPVRVAPPPAAPPVSTQSVRPAAPPTAPVDSQRFNPGGGKLPGVAIGLGMTPPPPGGAGSDTVTGDIPSQAGAGATAGILGSVDLNYNDWPSYAVGASVGLADVDCNCLGAPAASGSGDLNQKIFDANDNAALKIAGNAVRDAMNGNGDLFVALNNLKAILQVRDDYRNTVKKLAADYRALRDQEYNDDTRAKINNLKDKTDQATRQKNDLTNKILGGTP